MNKRALYKYLYEWLFFMPGFWSRLQVACLAVLVPSSLSMILLYPSPIHVLFEGLVIMSGIMLVSAFRRVYTYLLFFVSLYLLAIARLYDLEGMRASRSSGDPRCAE